MIHTTESETLSESSSHIIAISSVVSMSSGNVSAPCFLSVIVPIS